ncbi:MAG: DMT family transporter [Rhizobiaceae bacterium]
MQSTQQANQAKGVMLGLFGGLVISFDVPMIRLAESDVWFSMSLRGFCIGAVFLALYLVGVRNDDMPRHPLKDRDWLTVGLFYGLTNIFFSTAVFSTSTANLVFILAFNPMISALLAWRLIGERPYKATWAAIAATMIGVAIIVSGGLGNGTYFGDGASILCSATLAYALVRTRQSGKDLSLAPGLGGLIAGLFALPFALADLKMPGQIGWLWANGLILVPVSGFCLALAPRYIPAPQTAIFFLLETVLAPVWVWYVFSEEPSRQTIIGGSIVLGAVLAHAAWGIARSRRAVPAAAEAAS